MKNATLQIASLSSFVLTFNGMRKFEIVLMFKLDFKFKKKLLIIPNANIVIIII